MLPSEMPMMGGRLEKCEVAPRFYPGEASVFWVFGICPPVNIQKALEITNFTREIRYKWAIFNSYVKLTEGSQTEYLFNFFRSIEP